VTARVLANAAGAMAGMIQAGPVAAAPVDMLAGVTMFGVTTPCGTAVREELERRGHGAVVFHATGTGGRAMEGLMEAGSIAAVVDATTTELADELVGGVLSAGPRRLEMAGRLGLPQVVSLGALDMVNFGPAETVPDRFADRRLHRHAPAVTLMRTSPEECAELGRQIAAKLKSAMGPTAVFVPRGGLSALDAEGGSFWDPEADEALFDSLRANLPHEIELCELDLHINDPDFGRAMAIRLDELVWESQ
jgi:uncharacterized protein (UPF0261 family)